MPADILDQLRTERTKCSEDGTNTDLIESLDLVLAKATSSSQALSVLNSIVASMNGNGKLLNENVRDICKSFKLYDRIVSHSISRTSGLSREFRDLGDDGKGSIHLINSELKTSLSLLTLVRKAAEKYSGVIEGLKESKGSSKKKIETPRRERSSFENLTKFAAGGKVGGSKKSGDNYVARLNAGEEVLKQEQARQIRQQLLEKKLNEKKLRLTQSKLQQQKKENEEASKQKRGIGKKLKEEVISETNLPKFAAGGEIKHGYRSGDRNIIRVNAGEWVLTPNQMKNLGIRLGLKSPNDVFRAAGGSPFRKSFAPDGLRKFDEGGKAGKIVDSIFAESNPAINKEIYEIIDILKDNSKDEKDQNDKVRQHQKEIEKILKNTGRKIDKETKAIERSKEKKQEKIAKINEAEKFSENRSFEINKELEELEKPSKERKEREQLFEELLKSGSKEEQNEAKKYLDSNDYQKTKGDPERIKELKAEREKELKIQEALSLKKNEIEASIYEDEDIINELREKKSDFIEDTHDKINEQIEKNKEDGVFGKLGNFGNVIKGLQKIGDLKFDILEKASKSISSWSINKGGTTGKVIGKTNELIGKAVGKTIAGAGKLGGMLAGAATKFAPVVGQAMTVYQAFEKVVKAIRDAYEYLAKLVKTDIKSSNARKAFDSQLGKGEYSSFEQSFGLLRDEMANIAPQIQTAVREGVDFKQMKEIAANIKGATGELDSTLFSKALEAIKGMSEGEVNALMGSGTSADKESMYAAIGEKGNADEIADLMEKGVFNGGEGGEEDKNADLNAEGITAGDKAVVTELRVITRFIEDFKHSISKFMEGPLKAAFGIIIEPLKAIWEILQPIITLSSMILSEVGQGFQIIWKVVKPVFSSLTGIAKASNNFLQKISELRSGILQKIIDGLDGFAATVSKFSEGLWNMVLSPILSTVTSIYSCIEDIIDLIPFAGSKNKNKDKNKNEAAQMRLLGALQRDLKKINSGQYSRNETSKREAYKRNINAANNSYGGEAQMKSNMSGAMQNAFAGFSKDMTALGESAVKLSKLEGEARLEGVKEFVAQQQVILEKHSNAVDDIINTYKSSLKFLNDAKANLEAGKGGMVSGGPEDYYSASANFAMTTANIQQSRVKDLRENYDKARKNLDKEITDISLNLSDAVSPEKRKEAEEFAFASKDLAKAKADALAHPNDRAKIEKAQELEKQVNQLYDHLTNGMSEADKLVIDGIQNASSAMVAGAAAITKAEAEAKSAVYNAIKQLAQWDELWKESYGGMATNAASRNIQASQNLAMQNLSVSQASRATDAGMKNAKLQRKLADEDNKSQRASKLAAIDKAQNEAKSKLKDATGSERVKLEKQIKEYDAARVVINQQYGAQAKENRLKEMEAVKAAAEAEFNVKEKIVDLARQEYDIQMDLMQSIGAPMEQIIDLERQRIGLVEAQLDNAKEYYNRLKENGASEMELRQASLNVQKQEANVVKARLGAQRSAMEKIFGNMIGAFSEVAGIIGPNSEYANASKFGMGYTKNPDGTVARGGGKTGGYRDRLFAQNAGGKDMFDETNKGENAEDSEASFQDNILKDLKSIKAILEEIREEEKKEEQEKKNREIADAKKAFYGESANKTDEERRKMTLEERADSGGSFGKVAALQAFKTKYSEKLGNSGWFGFGESVSDKIINDEEYREKYLSKIGDEKHELINITEEQIRGKLVAQSRGYLSGDVLNQAVEKEKERIKNRLDDINQQEKLISQMGGSTEEEIMREFENDKKNYANLQNGTNNIVNQEPALIQESKKPEMFSYSEGANDKLQIGIGIDPQNGNITAYVDRAIAQKWNKDGRKMINEQMTNGAAVS